MYDLPYKIKSDFKYDIIYSYLIYRVRTYHWRGINIILHQNLTKFAIMFKTDKTFKKVI